MATYECSLSADLVKKAQKELNEKAKYRAKDIQNLRDMVNAHPGLKCPTDDKFLLRYLRARKFDYDRAYEMLLNNYQIRAENADHFANFKPSAIKHVLEDGVSIILPKPDKHGRRILYLRPGLWDPAKFGIFDIMRTNIMNLEKVILDEPVQINGVLFLGNVEDIGMTHLAGMDRSYGRIMSSVLQDAFPLRLKGMHICNEPSIFGTIFAFFKPFLKEKTKSRIFFHGIDHKNLIKELGTECLPQELGGTSLPPTEQLAKEWAEELLGSEAMFEEMAGHHLEIDRNIIKKKNDEMVETLVGTYKKLNVD